MFWVYLCNLKFNTDSMKLNHVNLLTSQLSCFVYIPQSSSHSWVFVFGLRIQSAIKEIHFQFKCSQNFVFCHWAFNLVEKILKLLIKAWTLTSRSVFQTFATTQRQITANELSQYFNLHCTVHLHEQLHACDHMCVSAAWGISLSVCPPVISLVSGPVVYSLRPLAY